MAKRKLAFWRPYQGKGAAAIFESDVREGTPLTFLSIMPEVADEKFDSKQKISVKLGLADLGEFLLVLNRYKGGLGAPDGDKWKGLFHKNPNGSSTISLSVKENKDGLYLGVSSKKGEASAVRLGLSVSLAEAEVLKVFLEDAVRDQLVDNYQPKEQSV